MNAEQAWQAVLGQLQMEMPRASFDTWVRDTRFLEWDDRISRLGLSWCNHANQPFANQKAVWILSNRTLTNFKFGKRPGQQPIGFWSLPIFANSLESLTQGSKDRRYGVDQFPQRKRGAQTILKITALVNQKPIKNTK
jgi:hypothetical protein